MTSLVYDVVIGWPHISGFEIGVERLFNSKFQTSDNLKPIIKQILELGADPYGINFTGATPLHLMADEAYRFAMA